MDNRIFNVNGQGKIVLIEALRLAWQRDRCRDGDDLVRAQYKGYALSPEHGLILLDYVSSSTSLIQHAFIVPHDAQMAGSIAWDWLSSIGAQDTLRRCESWDRDADHDGSNEVGWRVYCEDWGHVAGMHNAVVAIKPVYLWYGK